MRLTVHHLTQLPDRHSAHAGLILQGQLLPADQPFLLATFNDRAVALAWRRHEQITFFAVRDITRRRGVGSELLRQLQQEAKADGLTRLEFHLTDAPADDANGLAAFFIAHGFEQKDGVLSCSL
ncbi:acetyl-CoA sensor PanZ family protein [Oceanimonas sp. CHS3-5]|uniref:acetyl-CoA sensor PanZ family protein n=1 Tax=Oceanimonas sp. CHS3-5 TaxID=3068186 RepID=UPI00273FF63C|nr:acetyl-CoA sensor PanZ family protein [Oceanimonas sp. CHS3-5]MDP5293261.1 acetyl-CoA sensor PanZ family protein [Oceanimonas sp. CHS3-5]